MPYRGPPSKGCLTCRKRKIRCDQRPGICLNCEKAKRECGGYRDAVDMMFLDETQEVTRKMQGVSTFDYSYTEPPNQNLASTVGRASKKRLPISLNPDEKNFASDVDALSTQLEAQATAFFFTHFTQQSTFYEDNQSLFSNLSPNSPEASSIALYNSILALGLIGLYHYPPEPLHAPLPEHAQAKYLAAVRALNRAICDPVEVKHDATLLAVTILIMYETFAIPASGSPDPRSKTVTTLTSWSNHVDGAAAILEIRGPEQFLSRDGRRLFVQAGIPLCINCMQRGVELPECITNLTVAARELETLHESQPIQRAPWRCFEFTVKFTAFWGKARQANYFSLPDLVSMAVTLDEEAVNAVHAILGSAPRRVIQKSDLAPGTFDEDMMPLGYCHEYALFNMAELSNGMRAMRIQINQLLRSVLLIGMTQRPPLFGTAEHTTLLQHATDTMRSMTDGIIASVPQYLGYLDGSRSKPVDSHDGSDPATGGNSNSSANTSGKTVPNNPISPPPTTPTFLWSHFPRPSNTLLGDATLPLVRSASGCHLPWALSTCVSVDTATLEQKQWAEARLRQMASECNLQQAEFLAERVRTRTWPEGWYRGVCPRDGRGWVGGGGEVR